METLLLQRYNTEIAIAQYDSVTNRCCDQDMRARPSALGGPKGPGGLLALIDANPSYLLEFMKE